MPLTRFSVGKGIRPAQLLGISFFLLGTAQAQMTNPAAETKNAVEPTTQTATDAPVSETAAGPKRAWTIVPRITLGETLTDNVLLSSTNKRSEQISEISPGIHIRGESARLKAYFDYSRREMFYAQDSGRNQSQNALNTFGTLEALERLLYVDFSGGIAQQAISAFGVQSPGSSSINANQTETSSYRLSPYLKGKLAGSADYELRYAASTTHSNSSGSFNASDIDQREWTGRLNGVTTLSSLLWSVDGSQQTLDYSQSRKIEAAHWRATLSYLVDPTLKLSVLGGREENNYLSIDKVGNKNYGYGLEWYPTVRTKFSFEREKRFFGNSHHLAFEHRTAHTALRLSDSRDVSVSPTNGLTGGSIGNIYDLMFSQLASVEPDPVLRAVLVNNFLQANNLAPNTPVTSGFLNSGPTLQRSQNISFALIGVRNTLTFVATQSETQRLGVLTAGNEDLAQTNAVRQRGFSISLAHQLSPLTSLNLMGTRQASSASSGGAETNIRMFNATLSSKLGAHTTGSFGLRRVTSSGLPNPYTENAFVGTLTLQY